MTNTNKRIIDGIRFIARDTQKIKIWDRTAYAWSGSSAVVNLLNKTNDYQDKYMKEFDIFQSAAIKYGKIDIAALKAKARTLAEDNEEIDEDEAYYEMFDKAVEKVNPPHSVIMEHITDEIGYYHEVQLYDGSEWYDETEIDTIDYDDGEKGTFTLKEEEKNG